MKTVIEMARQSGYGDHMSVLHAPALERFAELVRADEREKYKWDVHSCGPTCTKAACVAMREAVEAEREACLHAAEVAVSLLSDPVEAIRARRTHEL
jgi:hypothetical protein